MEPSKKCDLIIEPQNYIAEKQKTSRDHVVDGSQFYFVIYSI